MIIELFPIGCFLFICNGHAYKENLQENTDFPSSNEMNSRGNRYVFGPFPSLFSSRTSSSEFPPLCSSISVDEFRFDT